MGGVAGKGLFYFCCGHAFALLSSVLPTVHFTSPLAFAHTFVLGFMSVHIFIHAPTMLPPIFGTRNARRFNCLPFALTAIAAFTWPLEKDSQLLTAS